MSVSKPTPQQSDPFAEIAIPLTTPAPYEELRGADEVGGIDCALPTIEEPQSAITPDLAKAVKINA